MSSGDRSRGLNGLGGTAAVPPVGARVAGLAPDFGFRRGPPQQRSCEASWPHQRPPLLAKAHRCFKPVGDPPRGGTRTWGAGGRRCPHRSLPQGCGEGVGTRASAPRAPPGLGPRASCCPGSGHQLCAAGKPLSTQNSMQPGSRRELLGLSNLVSPLGPGAPEVRSRVWSGPSLRPAESCPP